MKKHLYIAILFCLCSLCAHAETLLLRTGARVKGEIVFQNEEVVVLRDPETGARSQYPRSDIAEIRTVDEVEKEEVGQQQEELPEIKTTKKASILLELAGGAAIQPGEPVGGGFSVDLLAGSHHIGNRHLFIGAGLGYHGVFFNGENYNFLPLQAALRMPMLEQKHAPVFGVAVGYGIALSKDYLGGLYAGLDIGYRCQLNPKSALSVTAFTQFQQAILPLTETIGEDAFVNNVGRNLLTCGLKLTLSF